MAIKSVEGIENYFDDDTSSSVDNSINLDSGRLKNVNGSEELSLDGDVSYEVKSGDNLNAISNQFGVSLDELLDANPQYKSNPSLIFPGDKIIIPSLKIDKTEMLGQDDVSSSDEDTKSSLADVEVKDITYTVQGGDTLGDIALKYLGDRSRYQEIADYNGISDPNMINVNQVIKIPVMKSEDDSNLEVVSDVASQNEIVVDEIKNEVSNDSKENDIPVLKELGNDTINQIYSYLYGRGLDDTHIAAIIGNIFQECTYDYTSNDECYYSSYYSKPTGEKVYNKGELGNLTDSVREKIFGLVPNAGGIGLFQWTGGHFDSEKGTWVSDSEGSRKSEFINYCNQHHLVWTDIGAQLEFFMYEYDNWYGKDTFESLSNVYDATDYFCDRFEIPNPAYANKDRRRTEANRVLDSILNTSFVEDGSSNSIDDGALDDLSDGDVAVEAPNSNEEVLTASSDSLYTDYTVVPNDTLSKIASSYGTTVDEILKLNPDITNPNQINVNQKIHIPSISNQITDSSEDVTLNDGEVISDGVSDVASKSYVASPYAIEPHSKVSAEERRRRIQILGGECGTEAEQDAKMQTITVPIWDGSKESSMELTVNKSLVSNYQNVFRELTDKKYTVFPYCTGAYDYGHDARPSGAPSDHTLGSAIDFNWDHNWFYGGDGSDYSVRKNDDIINIFAKEGFYWGGDWDAADDMHFTWAGY